MAFEDPGLRKRLAKAGQIGFETRHAFGQCIHLIFENLVCSVVHEAPAF